MRRFHLAILVIGLSIHPLSQAATSNQISKQDFRASVCNIADLTISYTFEEAYGEALISSKMKWLAGPNTSPECLTKSTFIYLRLKKADGSIGYIKLSPEIVSSGQPFGPASTESPMWEHLICNSTSKNSRCLTGDEAKTIYLLDPRIDRFEVVAEASIAQSATIAASRPKRSRSSDGDFTADFSFDSMLEQAIDKTMQPAQAGVIEAAAEPAPEDEKISAQELAEQAKNNVVILINTKLAQYATPASACESGRSVANSVSVKGTCQINFRSDTKHQFLCANDGKPKEIRSSRNAELDFARDIERISPLRISESGWVALILNLKQKLGLTDNGNYRVNRWQFTTTGSQLKDMETLASSLATLKSYCEKNS